MKYLLLSLLFIFSANAGVFGNYVKVSNLKGDSRKHKTKDLCESIEGESCLSINDKDMRRFKLGQEDDLDSPIFRLPNNSPIKLDCSDSNDCRTRAMGVFDGETFPDRVCLGESESTERWDILANHPGVTGITFPWFIWCEKETGSYNQNDIIINDAAGETAADAEDAQLVADNSARDTAKPIRITALQDCIQDSKNPTLTPDQIKSCIAAIVREMLGNRVAIPDL